METLAILAKHYGRKLLADLAIDPEKTLINLAIFVGGILLALLLFFVAPIVAFTSLPSFLFSHSGSASEIAAQTQLISMYQSVNQDLYNQGMQWVKQEESALRPYDDLQESKSYDLSWIDLMAIDSIRYNQDFNSVTLSDIKSLAQKFVIEKSYKETYQVYENKQLVTKTRAVITFSTVPFESMLSSLGFSDSDKSVAENIDRTLIELVAFPASSVANPAYPLAYADVVSSALANHPNITQSLFLALITHESGGNWRAFNRNTNGTNDAGLCQINSANWGKYGLTQDPYSPSQNIAAGVAILADALQQYGDELDALYAYNAGTPANGKQYNPTYAPGIEAVKAQISGSSIYTGISYTQVPGHPIDLLAAENNGQRFYNPAYLEITDTRTGERKTINKSSGDGNAWATQAAVYPVIFNDIEKGDTLTITFPDGKTSSVSITQNI